MRIGLALCSEEHGPRHLVEQAVQAEAAGFEFALISDHFHPWIDHQGHSPFVWTTLGGIAHATTTLRVGTGVTCPILRIHPAIVAHAAATCAAMMPARFFLGVGTGEALNEHVLGQRWPATHVRRDMLREAVEVMRTLWSGDLVSHSGPYYTVENARLYTVPDEQIEVMVAAGGPEAAALAAEIGDGLIATAPDEETVEAFASGGGESKPRYGQLTVCYASTEAEARRIALEHWPNAALKGPLGQELPLPSHFEQAVAMISEDDIAESVVCTPDPEAHIAAIREFEAAGFTHVAIHQVGPDNSGFLELYADEILAATVA